MKRSVAAGDFIEWAEFSGNMYGTRSVSQSPFRVRRERVASKGRLSEYCAPTPTMMQ